MINSKRFWITHALFLLAGMIIGLLLAPALGLVAGTQAQEKPKDAPPVQVKSQAQGMLDQISGAFEQAAAAVSPSVVAIVAEQQVVVKNPFAGRDNGLRDFFGDDFFRRFFGTPPAQDEKRTVRSLGSGVIVSKDGLILTNNHVVAKAQKLSVVISDKKKLTAKVIGTDPHTDIALIKVDAQDLPVAALGDSKSVKVGQWVIAVGNPFQLMRTVTAGIISAKGRSSVGLADYEDFIQTDASINPGNSGGALADLEGRVIGINTAIESPSGGSIGIGFAVPIEMAREVMDQLLAKGRVIRGYLGLTPQDVDENLAKAFKLKAGEGVLVGGVEAKGPAERGGIKPGDVILEFGGQKIEDTVQFRSLVAKTEPKTLVKIKLVRDGKPLEVQVTLGERPADAGTPSRPAGPQQKSSSEKLGLDLQDLTPDLAEQLGFKNEHGAVVAGVAAGSAGEDAGLQRGDLIKAVQNAPIQSAAEFEKALSRFKSGDAVALSIRRGASTFYLAIKIP